MSDDDQTQPVRPGDPAPAPGLAPPPAGGEASSEAATPPPTSERRGFRERLRTWRGSRGGGRTFGLAALIASALAGVIVGGLGFAAVHAITDDGGRDHDRGAWVERRDGEDPGRGGMHGGPRGVPGQLPPTTAPEDDEGSAS